MRPRFVLLTQERLERERGMALLGGREPPAAAGDSIDRMLADAFNANSAILAYATAVAQTNLPALPRSAKFYEDFVTGFTGLKTRALVWQNSVVPRVIDIPSAIVNSGTVFRFRIGQIDGAIETLLADPGNRPARDSLAGHLADLSKAAGLQRQTLQELRQDVRNFGDSLARDAAILKTAAADGLAAIGDARGQIQAIERDLAELRRELDKYNTNLTTALIGGADAIGIAVLGAGLAFVLGPLASSFLLLGLGLFFLVIGPPGAVAAFVIAILASSKIQAINARIAERTAELTLEGQQVTALAAINQIVDGLAVLAEAAGRSVGAIEQAWQALQGDVDAVLGDLGKAAENFSRDRLLALQSDIATAAEDWTALAALAGKFAGIRYVISPAITPIAHAA